jgi:hypothetical protein
LFENASVLEVFRFTFFSAYLKAIQSKRAFAFYSYTRSNAVWPQKMLLHVFFDKTFLDFATILDSALVMYATFLKIEDTLSARAKKTRCGDYRSHTLQVSGKQVAIGGIRDRRQISE